MILDYLGVSKLIPWFLKTGGPSPAGFGVTGRCDHRKMVEKMQHLWLYMGKGGYEAKNVSSL